MKYPIRIGLACLLAILSGCGYHMRGSIALPEELKNVYMFGASPTLQSEIAMILQSSKGKLTPSPNDAGLVVKFLKEDMRNRTLSVGSTGKSSEVELNYYLRFQFYDNKEAPLMDEQTIELSREYFNDQTAILAKESEDHIIRKEMYKQAARMLVSRAQIAVERYKK